MGWWWVGDGRGGTHDVGQYVCGEGAVETGQHAAEAARSFAGAYAHVGGEVVADCEDRDCTAT